MWRLAEEVQAALASMRAGSVLAVWEDGSLTVEKFSFWARRLPDGAYEKPVTTFVAGGWLPPVEEIADRLSMAADMWQGRGGPGTPLAG